MEEYFFEPDPDMPDVEGSQPDDAVALGDSPTAPLPDADAALAAPAAPAAPPIEATKPSAKP